MARTLAANLRAKLRRFRAGSFAMRDSPVIFCRLDKGIAGYCWATMAADATDYLIAPGVIALLNGPGLLVPKESGHWLKFSARIAGESRKRGKDERSSLT
jgi:hypothetical protein